MRASRTKNMKFEDRSHEQTVRQQRCALSKAWNLARNIYKLKEKDKAAYSFSRGAMGIVGCVNKRAGRKRVCGRFGCEHAYGQQERPWLCRVGDHQDIKESDDGDDGQRRGANKRRSDGVRQRIGLARDSGASWRNTRSSFLEINSVRIMGMHTTGRAVKNHISPKMAKESIAIKRTTYHSLFLPCRRVPLHHPHLLLQHIHRRILWLVRKIPQEKEMEVRVRSHGETRCLNQQKPKTLIKMKETKKYTVIYCMNCRIGCRSLERIWSIKEVLQSHTRWVVLAYGHDLVAVSDDHSRTLHDEHARAMVLLRPRGVRLLWRSGNLQQTANSATSCKPARTNTRAIGLHENPKLSHQTSRWWGTPTAPPKVWGSGVPLLLTTLTEDLWPLLCQLEAAWQGFTMTLLATRSWSILTVGAMRSCAFVASQMS